MFLQWRMKDFFKGGISQFDTGYDAAPTLKSH